jgi:hypothetical protein
MKISNNKSFHPMRQKIMIKRKVANIMEKKKMDRKIKT